MLETRVIINISAHPCYPTNMLIDFHGLKKNKWLIKKTEIFKTTNFQKMLEKISGIGPTDKETDES